MRFVLYSEKTVAQCLSAVNARMHVKETSTRPALDGWIEKSGTFSLAVTAPVIGKFTRRTTLTAKVERQGSITVIEGGVPSGVAREGQAVIFVALAVVALAIMASGNFLFGVLLIPFTAYLYIPLHGDYLNSAVLIDEVEKTLKAKPKPPKKLAEAKPVATRTSTPRATTRSASSTKSAATKTAAPKRAPARSASSAKLAEGKSLADKSPAASKPSAESQPAALPLPPSDEFPPTDEFPVSGGVSPLPSESAESSP